MQPRCAYNLVPFADLRWRLVHPELRTVEVDVQQKRQLQLCALRNVQPWRQLP